MIAFLIYVLVLWLAWRWLCRWADSQAVEIAPPPPPPTTITINVYKITVTAKRAE